MVEYTGHDAKTLHFRRENVILGQKVIKYNIFEIIWSLYVRIFVKNDAKKLKFYFGAFLQLLAGAEWGGAWEGNEILFFSHRFLRKFVRITNEIWRIFFVK